MAGKRKAASGSSTNKILQVILAVSVVIILMLSAFVPSTFQQSASQVTPTLGSLSQMPTVPPGGTRVVATRTQFHSSGLMSVPKLDGWDMPAQGGEESRLADGGDTQRIGLTFINSPVQSVVHIFVERSTSQPINTLDDLGTLYSADNLKGAWEQYTGGWRELSRGIKDNLYVIDFALSVKQTLQEQEYLENYLGRQVSRLLGNGWMQVTRLVAPDNNPALLDSLQSAVIPNVRFYPQVLNTPLQWKAIGDYAVGFVIKHPADWSVADSRIGQSYTLTGVLGANALTMTLRILPDVKVQTEADARAWVTANTPRATIQTVKGESINNLIGYTVSYIDPDPDGNQRSAATTLLNSGSKALLFVLTFQYSVSGLDLTDFTNVRVPPDLNQVRNSFFEIPASDLIATAMPLPTGTPLATAAP